MKNVLLSSLLLLLAACGQSPHDQLVDAIETTQSWAATAHMAGDEWEQGNIPDQYTQQTLTKGQEEISKAAQNISDAPPLFQHLQQSIQEMTLDVEKHDRKAIASPLQKIKSEQQQLDTWAQAQGVEP